VPDREDERPDREDDREPDREDERPDREDDLVPDRDEERVRDRDEDDERLDREDDEREPDRPRVDLLDPDRERPLLLARELFRDEERLARRGERRWSEGISDLTTSLTRRCSSAFRNFAIRSSSRRMLLASWAVSRSPTASASDSSRV
jgi:hypothetical protein